MPEPNKPNSRQQRGNDPLDDQLAAFTDQVLAGNATKPDLTLSDRSELRALQDIVLRLHRNLPDTAISRAMSRRIQSRLSARWKAEGPQPRPASVWKRIRDLLLPERQTWQSSSAGRQVWALRTVAVALVVILTVVAVFTPDLGDNLSGAAGLAGRAAPLVIVFIGAAAVAVWWWVRKKRKP